LCYNLSSKGWNKLINVLENPPKPTKGLKEIIKEIKKDKDEKLKKIILTLLKAAEFGYENGGALETNEVVELLEDLKKI
jgi:hypothetical protein